MEVPVADNQRVKAGETLFRIDPRFLALVSLPKMLTMSTFETPKSCRLPRRGREAWIARAIRLTYGLPLDRRAKRRQRSA